MSVWSAIVAAVLMGCRFVAPYESTGSDAHLPLPDAQSDRNRPDVGVPDTDAGDGAGARAIFRDPFDDGILGWNCFDGADAYTDGLFLEENEQLKIAGENNTNYKICLAGEPSWTDYAVEVNVTNLAGVDANIAALLFRVDARSERAYFFELHERSQSIGITVRTFAGASPEREVFERKDFAVSDQSYHLRVEVNGSSIKAFVDGEVVLQGQDAELPVGQIGLGVIESEAIFEDLFVFAAP